eukprot:7723003-Pyramimonas_sp.AAC.2
MLWVIRQTGFALAPSPPVCQIGPGLRLPSETTTLLVQNGGAASGSQDSWAKPRGPPDAVSPTQTMTLMGSVGQPTESDFDSGTDADTSSDDEATALDYSDMPTYLTEEQQAQCLFFKLSKTQASLAELHEETSPKSKTHCTTIN